MRASQGVNLGINADVIHARAGDDEVEDDRGRDRVYLGRGNDLIRLRNDGQHDRIHCSKGVDSVVYYGTSDKNDELTDCDTVSVVPR